MASPRLQALGATMANAKTAYITAEEVYIGLRDDRNADTKEAARLYVLAKNNYVSCAKEARRVQRMEIACGLLGLGVIFWPFMYVDKKKHDTRVANNIYTDDHRDGRRERK